MATSFRNRLGSAPEEGVKAPCVCATTANITLSGEQTIDGVAVVAGNRVLVRLQTDSTENGIYDCAVGAWTRATDFNDATDVVDGVICPDSNDNVLYMAVFSGTYDPDTTSVTFVSYLSSYYLGAFAVAPTLDNDGNALVAGQQYFNTANDTMYVRTSGDAWAVTSIASSAFIGTLLDDATAGDALTTLGITAFVQTLLDDASATAFLATLGLTLTPAEANILDGSATTQSTVTLAGTDGVVISDGDVMKQCLVSDFATYVSSTISSLTSGTAIATTSGTEAEFTGLPSGLFRVTMSLSLVSTNGSNIIRVHLGDSGGYETSGYDGVASDWIQPSTIRSLSIASGGIYLQDTGNASQQLSGILVLTLIDASTNTWAFTFNGADTNTGYNFGASGSKSLSGTLDRLKLTMDGVDVFDGGKVNILYE